MHYSNKKVNLKIIFSLSFVLFFTTVKLIAQPLSADGGLSQTICNGNTTTIGGSPTANYGSPGYTYSWAPAAGLSSTTVSNPTASPTSTTTYTIQVTDAALTVATSTLTITVNPLPTVDALLNPSSCNGATLAATNFTSTPPGATFNWTNSNPSIGISGSGVGDIPPYTATNSGSTSIVGTINITATLAGCTGPPTVYTIAVRPTPIVTSAPMAQTRCSGVNCNFALTSSVIGTSFSWTTSGLGVTGNTASSGAVISQSVSATGATPGTANYIVTPIAAGCVGSVITPVLTVNPIPVATASTSPLARCSGDTVSFSVSSNVSGTTFSWSSFSTNASGADPSGTGTSVFDTVTATTSSAGSIAYFFTPLAAGCTGTVVFPFVNVNPYPDANFSYSSSGCQFSPNALPSFLPGASAGTFTSTAGMVINPSTGEIDLTTSTPGSYLVTNTIGASGGCPSVNVNQGFTITPFPDVAAFPVTYPATCSGGLFSITFSSSVSGTTFPWTSSETATSGSALSGTGNISEILSASIVSGTTTYTITPTKGACPGTPLTYPVNVTAMPIPNLFFPAGPFCEFGPNIFPSFPGAAVPGILSVAPSGLIFVDTLTGEIDMTTSAPGTYDITNTIAAASGCPTTSFTFPTFIISPFYNATIANATPVCNLTAPFDFFAGSTGGTWSGTGITDNLLGTFNPLIAGIGTHTITYTPPGSCSPLDTTVIIVTGGDIDGNVTYSGGALNSGLNTAVLFDYSSTMSSFDTVQVSSIDGLGYYHFTSILGGTYLIKAFADTLIYPLVVPSYYANEYLWDSATIYVQGCMTDTADILMYEGIVTAGPGMLSGTLIEGVGFVRLPGEPIPGIDVKLGKNPGGAMITNTQTGPTGAYSFANISINSPGEFYTVYVDIPGLQRDSVYNIIVTATDFLFPNLDYEADSNSVYPTFPMAASIVSAETDINNLNVFPNPTNNISTVNYTLAARSSVELNVYDVLGKKLQTLVNTNQPAGKQQATLAKLNPGVYFIKLNISNNQNQTIRLVVTD